ncbi:MAG: hypothetical protein GIW94_02515 [Candidatus Eremiobacteraeota bacterium]|nr:hypothetical protein [Candidatus Eremiobacteraeota bacterium]MBC5820708.1 hypothetical protein [Candidatus Eremiobacteraeota bacterium]
MNPPEKLLASMPPAVADQVRAAWVEIWATLQRHDLDLTRDDVYAALVDSAYGLPW